MSYQWGVVLKGLSILQIYLIVISSFAFVFIISKSSIVSAQAPQANSPLTLPMGNPGAWTSNAKTGELLFHGNPTGYWNEGFPGLKPGTPTLDFSTGQVGRVGDVAGKDVGYLDRALGDDPLGAWKSTSGGILSHLTSGLIWGGIAYGVVSLVGGLFGLDDNQQEALSTATGN